MDIMTSKTIIQCPIGVQWSIPAHRLRKLKPGKYIKSDYSDAYNIPGLEYYLTIYPNDDEEGYEGLTRIFLHLEFSDDMEIEADFNISHESANFYCEKNHIYRISEGWGGTLCEFKELFDPEKQFIVDEKLTVIVKGLLTQEIEISKKIESSENVLDASLCLGLWNQDDSKDITIVADEREIMVHKNVLAIRSPVFVKMIQESKVVIEDFPFKIVEKAIKLLYHQNLVSDASLDDKMKMLHFFDKYEIQLLKDNLEYQLITEIDSSNVCLLTNCALLMQANLKRNVQNFFKIVFIKENQFLIMMFWIKILLWIYSKMNFVMHLHNFLIEFQI